jgi:hypothetical protein
MLKHTVLRLLAVSFCSFVLVGPALVGCGSAVDEQTIEIPKTSAVDEAKQILQNYANGSPMGSEAADFPNLVNRVREQDPAKATVLEEGLKRLQAEPNNRPAIAKELLGKL